MTPPPSDRTQTVRKDVKNTWTSQAQLEGLFAKAVGDSAIADAKKKAAVSATWVALGEDVVKVVPFGTFVTNVGGGEVAKALVTFTINRTLDAKYGSPMLFSSLANRASSGFRPTSRRAAADSLPDSSATPAGTVETSDSLSTTVRAYYDGSDFSST